MPISQVFGRAVRKSLLSLLRELWESAGFENCRCDSQVHRKLKVALFNCVIMVDPVERGGVEIFIKCPIVPNTLPHNLS